MTEKQPQYSRQFLAEVEKHIDPKLTTFFLHNQHLFPVNQLKDAIYESLISIFKGCLSKDELTPLISTVKNSRFKKRSRWTKDYINTLKDLPRTDPNYPLDLLNLDEYDQEITIEKEVNNTLAWKDHSDSFFIDFPGISRIGKASLWSSFKIDLIICIWNYISTELNGDIRSFYRTYPETLVGAPLFSPSSFNLIMKETGNNLLEETVLDENGTPLLALSIPNNNKFTPPKVMDTTDLKILNTLIASVDNDFYRSKTVTTDIGTLTNSVFGFRPGATNYTSIAERCTKLVEYNYTILSDNGRLSFNLFDSIIVRYTGTSSEDTIAEAKDYSVIATFGEILANALIQKQLVKVTEKNYDTLKNPMSKIIYYALEKERVSLQGSGRDTCLYTYTYFQKIVRFKFKTRSKNLKLIEASLQDFVDNKICIDEFNRKSDGSFLIKFLPLSEEELDDINFKNPVLLTEK